MARPWRERPQPPITLSEVPRPVPPVTLSEAPSLSVTLSEAHRAESKGLPGSRGRVLVPENLAGVIPEILAGCQKEDRSDIGPGFLVG
jgi:hypothetical protein